MRARSGHRRSVFLVQIGNALMLPRGRIRWIGKSNGESSPILARLVKWLAIQHKPRVSIEIRNFFYHPTMKDNRKRHA